METSARVIPAENGEYSRPLRDKFAIADEVKAAYQQDFSHLRSPIKHVARLTLASPRSVEGWVNGTRLPSLENFLRLLPHSPGLQALVRRVSGMEQACDPQFQRALSEFVRVVQASR